MCFIFGKYIFERERNLSEKKKSADCVTNYQHEVSRIYCELKFRTLYAKIFCFFMQMFFKIFSGMANSVDPGSALFAFIILLESWLHW